MAFLQNLGSLRSPVSTYVNLPISGNTLGDLRIITDLGVLYTWMSSSGSGSLSDWKKVTVSSYNDLVNKPNSSPLAIDDAMQSVRNLYLNYVYLFFMSLVSVSYNVQKMLDGCLDTFSAQDGTDLTKTSGQRWLKIPTMRNYAGYYVNDFDGSLDFETKLLIHGYHLNEDAPDFFDALLNDIVRNDTTFDVVNTKFGNKSLSFNASETSYLLLSSFYNSSINAFNNDGNPFKVEGVDFTWDMWIRCNADAAETIMVDHSFNQPDGTAFKLEKLADGTVKATILGCTGYVWDMVTTPENPVVYDVTGATPIVKETWNHIALVRQNGYLKLFINGVLDGTSSVANNHLICDYNCELVVLNENGFRLGQGFNGQIEEVRCSKGIARYTSTFTPRTTPYNTPTQSSPCNNMVIQSEGFEANTIPTSARVVIFEQDGFLGYSPINVQEVIPNTDIKLYVSRDGGTTWTQATDLKIEMDITQEVIWSGLYSNVNFLVGTVNLASQPNGKEVVYKITTHNNKDLLIRACAINWK